MLRISIAQNKPDFDSIMANDKPLEIVTNVKVLALNISSDLKWNVHIWELVGNASSRLYFWRQLVESIEFVKNCPKVDFELKSGKTNFLQF